MFENGSCAVCRRARSGRAAGDQEALVGFSGTFCIPSCFCNTSGASDCVALFGVSLWACWELFQVDRCAQPRGFFVFASLSPHTEAPDLPPTPHSQNQQVCFRTEFERTYISFHNPYI